MNAYILVYHYCPWLIIQSCGLVTIKWFPSFVLVPVLFGSILFSAQNQNFGWFPSLVMIPSVVWLHSASCSKSTFWVVPINCHGSQCCLAPKCFLLKINILGGSLFLSLFPVLFGSKVLSAQNQHFRWFPSFLWFPVLFGCNVLSTQSLTF